MKTQQWNYTEGNSNLIGYIANEETIPGQKPVVMVCHAFEGCSQLMHEHAEKLAQMGYIGFAIDMYGDGIVETTFDECVNQFMRFNKDRGFLQKRIQAAFATAKALPQANSQKIAAIGFCFGGMCVLDLARSGADINGVVSIHGVFKQPEGLKDHKITAKVLALHGYDDPQTSPEQIKDFMEEMERKSADWQFHFFSHTKHAFTDPNAEKLGPPEMGRVYNGVSTKQTWDYIKSFLEEVFK